VLKNIEACKQLSHITRTSLGPHGTHPHLRHRLRRLRSRRHAPYVALGLAQPVAFGAQRRQGRVACGDDPRGLPCGHALHLARLPPPHPTHQRRLPFEGRGAEVAGEHHGDARMRLGKGACMGRPYSVVPTALRSLRRWPPRTQIALARPRPLTLSVAGGRCSVPAAVGTRTCTVIQREVTAPVDGLTGSSLCSLAHLVVGQLAQQCGGRGVCAAAWVAANPCVSHDVHSLPSHAFLQLRALAGGRDRPCVHAPSAAPEELCTLLTSPRTPVPCCPHARPSVACWERRRWWEIARQICWAGHGGHGCDGNDGPVCFHETLLPPIHHWESWAGWRARGGPSDQPRRPEVELPAAYTASKGRHTATGSSSAMRAVPSSM
jgi:hypothetical protein